MKQAAIVARALSLSVTVLIIHAITSIVYALVFGGFDSLSTVVVGASAVLVTAIGSGLAYKTVTHFLEGKLSRAEVFMKWLFKGAYLKGTWISLLRVRNNHMIVAIEHFEQTPFNFVIRGWSFDPSDLRQENATWVTRCTEIKPEHGKLHCLYATDVKKGDKLDRRDGIGTFDFGYRAHPDNPPDELTGYAIDSLEDYKIVYEKVIKIDSEFVNPRKAAEIAIKTFEKG